MYDSHHQPKWAESFDIAQHETRVLSSVSFPGKKLAVAAAFCFSLSLCEEERVVVIWAWEKVRGREVQYGIQGFNSQRLKLEF